MDLFNTLFHSEEEYHSQYINVDIVLDLFKGVYDTRPNAEKKGRDFFARQLLSKLLLAKSQGISFDCFVFNEITGRAKEVESEVIFNYLTNVIKLYSNSMPIDENHMFLEEHMREIQYGYGIRKTDLEYIYKMKFPDVVGDNPLPNLYEYTANNEYKNEYDSTLKDEQETKKKLEDLKKRLDENDFSDYEVPERLNKDKLGDFIRLLLKLNPDLDIQDNTTYSEIHTKLNQKYRKEKFPSKNTLAKYLNEID